MDTNYEPNKVTYEGDQWQQSAKSFQNPHSKMAGWIIKYSGGVVKNESQANYFMIGVIVVSISLSLYLIFSGNDNQRKPTPAELKQMSQMP